MDYFFYDFQLRRETLFNKDLSPFDQITKITLQYLIDLFKSRLGKPNFKTVLQP